MLYNQNHFPQYVKTAGKITVATAVTGLLVFLVAFVFDVGTQELSKVSAQTASTTLTVLNTPPYFVVDPYEAPESSTSSPTNSGDVITWEAVAEDSNAEPYYLLICSTNATPSPATVGPPSCSPTSTIQWGVSAATPSGSTSTVSTTTLEAAPFSTTTPNDWYAWVCDNDSDFPTCNLTPSQGTSTQPASSSPFHVNSRPILTNFYNGGPFLPGTDPSVSFLSTSSDPDLVGGQDEIFLTVCQTPAWSTSTNRCLNPADELASSTIGAFLNATTSFAMPLPIQDDTYFAYGFLYDEHGHEALNNYQDGSYLILNAAPYAQMIDLNSGDDMALVAGVETSGFTLDLTVYDYNGCDTALGTKDEIRGFYASVYRNGTTSCDALSSTYDPNTCYTNTFATSSSIGAVPTTTWALSCVASSTCDSVDQDNIEFTCTFPLWFVAEPTDKTGSTTTLPAFLVGDYWTAGIEPFDDNAATGTRATSSSPVDVLAVTGLDVLSEQIAYGSLEPGNNNPTLSATSTIISIGNTGLDQEVRGDSMCDSYAPGNECVVSTTDTIPESEQQFASTSLAYDATGPLDTPGILALSSTTDQEVELDIVKATSTLIADAPQGTTYWGIRVPGSITKSGDYTGMNTFTAVMAEPADWY